MNSKALLAIAVALITVATTAGTIRPTTAAAELKALQGTWNLVETESQGQTVKPAVVTQWVFAGQKLFLRTGKKSVLQGVVSLDPSQKPKVMDVVGKGTPAILGIFELSGHKLKVAAAPNERPAAFTAEGSTVVSILERAKAPHVRHRGRALL